MQLDRSQTPDVIERIGIVIWKIAVLLIALRCILALIPQQDVLDGLSIGSIVLQGSALVLMGVGGAWAVICALGASWLPRPHPPRRRGNMARPTRDAEAPLVLAATHGMHRLMWCGSNWMLALGLESMLAAQIIQASIVSAGQNELSWWRMSVVVIIAIGRILI